MFWNRKSTITRILLMCLVILSLISFYFFFKIQKNAISLRLDNQSVARTNLTREEWPAFHFVETSGKRKLMDAREACSIESAALHNPHRVINYFIVTESPIDFTSVEADPKYLVTLLRIPNVRLKPLNLTDIFTGTPLDEWHRNSTVKTSAFPMEHLSDAVRLALLYQYGGTYFDTDVISLRSMTGLIDDGSMEMTNAVGLQRKEEANGAVLVSFDPKHGFLHRCMLDYVMNFMAENWAYQGPDLITRVLRRTCRVEYLSDVIRDPDFCEGVTIMPQKAFYPIEWTDWYKLFKAPASKDDLQLIKNAYTVHLWAKLTRNMPLIIGNGCVLDKIAKENCPKIYKVMFESVL